MMLRLLGPQGIAGIAAAICLSLLLVVQKGETRRWRHRSAEHERLYRAEQAAFAATVANYRAAADSARAADKAAAERVIAAQRAINERTEDEYEARLAAARALAGRLRNQAHVAAADRGSSRSAPMPGLSTAPSGAPQASRQDRLPDADRLIATEQAIQLDALIRWVKAQRAVDPGGGN